MTLIINLTQHIATPEQIRDGVVDLSPERRERLLKVLTLDARCLIHENGHSELASRAHQAVLLACEEHAERTGGDPDPMGGTVQGAYVMIGGHILLTATIAEEATGWGMRAILSVSDRVSVETTDQYGRVSKTSVFTHQGWLPWFRGCPRPV